MKDRKKRQGTKAKVRAHKRRLSHIATAITITIILVALIISGLFIYSFLNSPPNQTIHPDQSDTTLFQLEAAIVDHLSLTQPNTTFVETATNMLEQAGFAVDYYPGEEITVEFYRNLAAHDYGLIVLRVHSAIATNASLLYGVSLFTSEPYSSTKYVYEQLTAQISQAAISEGASTCFGINPSFVKASMKGKLQNTIIIMMGCAGLKYNIMAQAFINKGAKVYIGWNELVQASHTDKATTHLLQHLITEKQTIKEAVEQTMKEVGPDPIDEGVLSYYPLEAADLAWVHLVE